MPSARALLASGNRRWDRSKSSTSTLRGVNFRFPMYYIFHGADEFSRTQQVNKFRAQMGDPQFADLNTLQFDGRKVALGELQHACDAVPFLAQKRLVIVEGMLVRFDPRHTK